MVRFWTKAHSVSVFLSEQLGISKINAGGKPCDGLLSHANLEISARFIDYLILKCRIDLYTIMESVHTVHMSCSFNEEQSNPFVFKFSVETKK